MKIFYSYQRDLVSEDLYHGRVTGSSPAIMLGLTPGHGLGAEEKAAQAQVGLISPARGTGGGTWAGREHQEKYQSQSHLHRSPYLFMMYVLLSPQVDLPSYFRGSNSFKILF